MKEEPQLEMLLPDEERDFILNYCWKSACCCGHNVAIKRRTNRVTGKQEFQVVCALTTPAIQYHLSLAEHRLRHYDPTPWMASSKLALQHWLVVAALSRS